MPAGLFIFSREDQNKLEIALKYPNDLVVPDNLLNIIDLSHEFKERDGFVTISVGDAKIASYYTGPQTNYFINLSLTEDENPIIFENPFMVLGKKITSIIIAGKINEEIENVFNELSMSPSFEEEIQLSFIYSDEVKCLIIKKLTESAYIKKIELNNWINSSLNKILNLDSVINSLSELGLVGITNPESDEYIFSTGDIFVTRLPPAEIIEKLDDKRIPEAISEKYIAKINEFFKNYSPTSDDEKVIVELISSPETYQLLKLFRISPATKKGLMKAASEIKDLESQIEKLLSNNVIEIIKDEKGMEFYFLVSDLRIQKFFPEYVLKKILNDYNNKSVSVSIIKTILSQLRNIYKSELERLKKEEEMEELVQKKE